MKKDIYKKEFFINPLDKEPRGKNNIASRDSFFHEKIYQQNSFSEIENLIAVEPINFYYDFPLFGRVDNDSLGIIPSSNNIVSSINSPMPVRNLNFAIDAFDDFILFWKNAISTNRISKVGQFYKIKTIDSYVDPVRLYDEFMNRQYDYFLQFLVDKNKTKDILNFNKFLRNFIEYFESKSAIIPVTFSSFCLSKFSDMRISGLVFDLSDKNKDLDQVKYNEFINDVNYPFFYNVATKYGFSIDKNIPWRLVANPNSIQMRPYLEKYESSSEKVFSTFYEKSSVLDLELMKKYMLLFFNNFIENNDIFVEPKIVNCRDRFKIKNKVYQRSSTIPENIDSLVVRAFIFMKGREANLDWSQAKFEQVVGKTKSLFKSLDIYAAMRYVAEEVNFQIESKTRNRTFQF